MVQQDVEDIEPLDQILRGGKSCRIAWACAGDHYLLRAARKGDEGLVRNALRQKADPNIMDPEDRCPALILACNSGSLGTVQQLCREGADLAAVDAQGISAVRTSLIARHPSIAAYLIEHSKGSVIANPQEWSDTLQLLVCQCPTPPQKQPQQWGHVDSQVWERSFYECTRLMKRLLEFPVLHSSALIAARNEATRQGLWQSIYRGHQGAVSVLLTAQVDPNMADKDDSRTALDLADALCEESIADDLVRCGARGGPAENLAEWALCLAAARGDVKAARKWLADVKDPNWRHKTMHEDFTPLMYAAGEGSIEIVDLLLDLRANAAMADKNGKTPIRLARERGHRRLLPPGYKVLDERSRADQSWIPSEKEEYVAIVEPEEKPYVAPVKQVKGKITLKIIRCTGLYDADLLGIGNLSDPYVDIKIRKLGVKSDQDKRKLANKTATIADNVNPVFNETFTFGPINLEEDEIMLNVFDEDPMTGMISEEMFRDQFLGKLTIPLKEKVDMLSKGEDWSINRRLKSQPADHADGKIELKISFTPQSASTMARGSARQNNAFGKQGSSSGTPSKGTSPATSGKSTPAPKAKSQHHDPF
eukprot:gnl/MRDRNA2_/MRDRNA2_109585_c0_seq1.p1 gnl/MRDRNA2_/MRDRNA2_109585_c0~~gnl/MRDRNA2_/MRDRNA2_109585_c0_seq1.p1  ORF type:complete len:592 (+),score=99.21 gnl/MRDRNA2_/MRDRNA2_109585_c0_seq1:104-1879(+)